MGMLGAGGPGGPGSPPSPGGPSFGPGPQSSPIAQAVSQQVGQLRAVNPQLVLQHLQQMKRIAAALVPHTAESIPGVARYMGATLRGIDGAIEAATKALQTQVAAGGPVQMSAAQPSLPTSSMNGGF